MSKFIGSKKKWHVDKFDIHKGKDDPISELVGAPQRFPEIESVNF